MSWRTRKAPPATVRISPGEAVITARDLASPARPMLILQPAPPAQDHCTHPRIFTKRRALSPAATTHCTSCGQTTPALPTPIPGGDQ